LTLEPPPAEDRSGVPVGHEPVGVIEKLGSAVTGYREGPRVIAGAIAPSGHNNVCLCGCLSQDGPDEKHGFKALGGWKYIEGSMRSAG
jgi:threonine dehydrogenase-like Zn-dependent dehydrogenase